MFVSICCEFLIVIGQLSQLWVQVWGASNRLKILPPGLRGALLHRIVIRVNMGHIRLLKTEEFAKVMVSLCSMYPNVF